MYRVPHLFRDFLTNIQHENDSSLFSCIAIDNFVHYGTLQDKTYQAFPSW